MSDSVGPEFWARADAIIHLANEHCKDVPNRKVSSSLLYAAARFNAYIVTVKASDLVELKADKEEAVEYFVDQYRKMLIENLDDHIENYNQYVQTT